MAIVIVILIFAFFIIMGILVEQGEKQEKKEREKREAQEKKEREQRIREREKRQNKLYDLALQIGKESEINHLHHIVFGFEKRTANLTPEQRELWDAARRALFAMEGQDTEPKYSNPPLPIPAQIPEPFDYEAPWWTAYSAWYRDKKRGICEECKLDLNYDRYYLHTHHIRGTQYNEPKDLKALCLGCHAEQPGHSRLKREPNYLKFIAKYGEQRKKTLNSFHSLSLQFEAKVVQTSVDQGYRNGQLGQYAAAIADYDITVRLKPDYALVYNNRGVAKHKLGQYDAAITDYDTAIRLKPDYALASKNRGLAKRKLD